MAGNPINHKPETFEQYIRLVQQVREQLSLNATPESTKLAVEMVNKGLDSGFLNSDDAGVAAITPSDTGLAPNKYLATGPMAPNASMDPGMKPVDPALAEKTAVAYDEATQEDRKAKDERREHHNKRKGKDE